MPIQSVLHQLGCLEEHNLALVVLWELLMMAAEYLTAQPSRNIRAIRVSTSRTSTVRGLRFCDHLLHIPQTVASAGCVHLRVPA